MRSPPPAASTAAGGRAFGAAGHRAWREQKPVQSAGSARHEVRDIAPGGGDYALAAFLGGRPGVALGLVIRLVVSRWLRWPATGWTLLECWHRPTQSGGRRSRQCSALALRREAHRCLGSIPRLGRGG